MKFAVKTLLASVALASVMPAASFAEGKTIAVSWKTFQEERWKTDEAAIKEVVEAAGNTYISTDAQLSASKQAADIEGLVNQGVDVIMVVAYDSDAILPSFQLAADSGVKMISYDVLVEDPNALYVTFDNVGVGRLMAQTMLEKGKTEGNFAFIKGDKGDPNATFLFQGIMEVLQPNIDSGAIKNVCETFTDGWKPDQAQRNMEQCLAANNNAIDAVVSENDGMAGGVVSALEAQGMAGSVPVTGQDGDHAALNRVALGTQLVSVWKDARVLGKTAAEYANQIAEGTDVTTLDGVSTFNGGPKGVEVPAFLIAPNAITQDKLAEVIDAGWVAKEKVCAGVTAGSVPACD
ncbi:sugar ABC transporter substrate-binding protein [Silicimonas algicola]|uniref:Xylose-binding protein n=1 Tax=Silicimonas algicola TaxID=1826607 RepID=A0A316GD72_9RHOB|nr:substrate-binding domain-containing protein [Silicimonas algicola]AZQ68129.1 sugar ABC transporter substrate-binding protein [Silicimonas algicola]PWK57410.1 xylose-binding protein [Silicimonas algicola]